jgi:hypothetical protein
VILLYSVKAMANFNFSHFAWLALYPHTILKKSSITAVNIFSAAYFYSCI